MHTPKGFITAQSGPGGVISAATDIVRAEGSKRS
jgi:hypothetical protein